MIAIKRRKWTVGEISEIRRRYQTSYISDLAERFGVPPRQLTAIASYYGIKKTSREFRIRKVKAEKSKLNLFDLMISRENIELLFFTEKDPVKIEKLIQIRDDLNTIIWKGTRKKVSAYFTLLPM